jgi:hypothetical protein
MSLTTLKRKAAAPDEAPIKTLRQIIHDVDNWACENRRDNCPRENSLNDLSRAMRDAYALALTCEKAGLIGRDVGQARTVAQPVHDYTIKSLFQVNAGIPAGKALNTASIYLASAHVLTCDAVAEGSSNGMNAVADLIGLARAIVDSVNAGLV